MTTNNLWPQLTLFQDGVTPLNADSMNLPANQLAQRTELLKSRLDEVLGEKYGESVRSVDLPLDSDDMPAEFDVVYVDADRQVLRPALAAIDAFSPSRQLANSALALGVLVRKHADNRTGTVAAFGRVPLEDRGGNIDLGTLTETNEEFVSGPYYLSSVEPGKITRNPRGPVVFVGIYTAPQSAGSPGYTMINVQAKDVSEAHIHRSMPIKSRAVGEAVESAAGVWSVHGMIPTSHTTEPWGALDGEDNTKLYLSELYMNAYRGLAVENRTKNFYAIAASNDTSSISFDFDSPNNAFFTYQLDPAGANWNDGATPVWEEEDEVYIRTRTGLIVGGDYAGDHATSYTLHLAKENGDQPSAGDFGDFFLHWVSDDPSEGTGLSRITSYEDAVPFGTKGLHAVFDNRAEGISDNELFGKTESANLGRRQWQITVPTNTEGWVANRIRSEFVSDLEDKAGVPRILLFGGPTTNPKNKTVATVTARADRMVVATLDDVPSDGDKVVLAGLTFEFDSDGSVDVGSVLVPIVSGSKSDTTQMLFNAIREKHFTARPALFEAGNAVVVGYSGTPSFDATAASTVSLGSVLNAGELVEVNHETSHFVVTDEQGFVLTESATVSLPRYTPIDLSNGLRIMVTGHDVDQEAAAEDVSVPLGTSWEVTVSDEAPGDPFKYTVGMNKGIRSIYPVAPFDAIAMTVNGVEATSYIVHPDSYTFRPGFDSFYWQDNANVPWPKNDNYNVVSSLHLAGLRWSNTGIVSSLRPSADSPIRVVQANTMEDGITGDLALDLDLSLLVDDVNAPGHRVFKRMRGNKIQAGPVVSRVRAGPGISIESAAGTDTGVGEVTIGVSDAAGFSGNFESVSLENAKQERIGMFPYIRLLPYNTVAGSNTPSGFVARFQAPYALPGLYQVLVYITLFGEDDYADVETIKRAGLSFSYSLLRDFSPASDKFDNLKTDLIEPPSPRAVEVPFGYDGPGTTKKYNGFDPMIVHNNPQDTRNHPGRIVRALGAPLPTTADTKGGEVVALEDSAVAAGTHVGIRVARSSVVNTAAEYTGALGVIKLQWRLVRIDQ